MNAESTEYCKPRRRENRVKAVFNPAKLSNWDKELRVGNVLRVS